MTQPTPYNKSRTFADSSTGVVYPVPASFLDTEFTNVERTLDEICTNLALIQRDDGLLANQSVHPDALSEAVTLMMGDWNPRGDWGTGRRYAKHDMVRQSSLNYVAVSDHTSGAFNTDLAAGHWQALGTPNSILQLELDAAVADIEVLQDDIGSLRLSDLATLRLYRGSATTAYVACHTAFATGGGGQFAVKAGDTTSVDNNSTVIVDPLGRRWWRVNAIDNVLFGPRWFGAKVNNVDDDTASWNLALAYLQARGGGVFNIPAGAQVVNGPLNYTGDNLSVRGAGPASTLIYKNSTTGNLFNFVGDKIDFAGFWVICNGVHTSGWLFSVETTGGNVALSHVWTYQGYDILKLGSGSHLDVSNCVFNNFRRYGIKPGPNWGGLTMLSSINMNCEESNQGSAIYLETGDTFNLVSLNCAGQLQPIVMKPPAGGTLVNVFCANVFADGIGRTLTGYDGWFIDGTAAGCTLGRIRGTNCWAGVNMRHGVFIVGNVDVVQFVNSYFLSNLGHGFYCTAGPKNVSVKGGEISGNSLLSPGTYSGIVVDDFISEFAFDEVRVGPTTLITTDNHAYNIDIRGTNHDHYRVRDNDLRGGVTGTMRDQGTGSDKTIRDNTGYRTANKGTGLIASGSTTATFNHGLAVTPTAADFVINFTEQGSNDYGRWWLSSINGTSCNLNVSADPGASNLDFSWSVRCLQ